MAKLIEGERALAQLGEEVAAQERGRPVTRGGRRRPSALANWAWWGPRASARERRAGGAQWHASRSVARGSADSTRRGRPRHGPWLRLVAALACAHGFFSSAPGVRYNTQLAASKDKDCQVFVKNLPWKADSQAVREAMERFGAVVEVRLPPLENDANSHRGYGFVTFAEHTAAEAAVIPADAPQLLGRELLCSPANQQRKTAAPSRGATFAALRRARRRADIERCYEARAAHVREGIRDRDQRMGARARA